MSDLLPSKERNLPLLLRDAERRVNAHVFRRGGDDSLASIPANVDRDVDLLLMEAAAEIERLTEAVADKESDCARLHSALMDAKYPETAPVETPAEPDAWMSAERDRVMTAETKRSFTKAATAGYTIPLYAHPASPPKTSGNAP